MENVRQGGQATDAGLKPRPTCNESVRGEVAPARTTPAVSDHEEESLEGGKGSLGDTALPSELRFFSPSLDALLADPLLRDVGRNPSLQDVETLIALEKGSGLRIHVHKLDGATFSVTVLSTASVRDLKRAVERRVNEEHASRMGHRRVSCTHCLATGDGRRLLTDSVQLTSDCDLHNNDTRWGQ
eukprot:jgi/Mesen1/7172/ME000037S06528